MATIAVVGNGPVGASVARALAVRHGCFVELFSSPTLWSAHDDIGRISRVLDFEHAREWQVWNRESLNVWRELERASGISFFHECGSAVFAPQSILSQLEQQLTGCSYSKVERASFVGGILGSSVASHGLLEPSAGYVNPKSLISAQNAILLAHGGKIRYETVEALRQNPNGGFDVNTAKGVHSYRQVVLCAGAFTNHLLNTLPDSLGVPLSYRVSRRTVLLCEVSEPTVFGELAGMPALKVCCDDPTGNGGSVRDAREAASAYILPPMV
eukprot:TRINITY_DN113033_c0_g1_i1.p1 TRINITY_DN113033_c0_g1~~TRINITY_DN113033_c0_g1_i1.p1  ORF type:complete len:292 (+),score=18.24 TRINITY_DN113033_c0_g1_i1:67-876(+)